MISKESIQKRTRVAASVAEFLRTFGNEKAICNLFARVQFLNSVSIEKHIDKLIGDAIQRGEFKNLRGEGKPINLDAYFATPDDVRLGYSVLKSNEFVPEEVDRLREIGELKEKLAACSDESEKVRLKKMLSEKELALALILERNRRRKR